ncbi:MAG: hypothetical protein MJZ75_06860 [Paludibacteraceae bacterium]|nr:hypothetical protein [Paludibacteraceae bacterium]
MCIKVLFILLAIRTLYYDKTYHTECAVDVNAPAEISDSILSRFIYDFQNSPDALFDWAFYGTGAQEDDQKNSFLLEYKVTEYFPERNYGRIVTDIVVPGLTRFKNITIEGTVIDKCYPIHYNPKLRSDNLTIATIPNSMRHMDIKVNYSGKLLDKGYGNLYIIPVDKTHSIYMMDINLKYGWFFNIFVTKRVYANSVEWRVNRYMQNLKQIAEKMYNDK